ncbi:hypothetical protein X975_06056, partial [Stegodyphus mimosarum]
MTKRKNAFEEIPFLTKMHIGVKEVNLGVNAKENMKHVYDKTQKLLFLGASRLHYNGSMNQCLSGNNTCSPQNLPASSVKKEGISCCNCCLSNIRASCYFCEQSLCSACSRVCQVCKNEFCQLCSLLKYDTQDETAMCLSCL